VLIAGAFGRIAGSALDVELFIPPIKQQIKKLNGDALIRLLGSPIEEPIYEARTKGKRYAKHLSPLQHLRDRYNLILDPLLHQDYIGSFKQVVPFVVPPWWKPPEVRIAPTKEQAIKEHDLITLYSGPGTMNIYTDGSGLDGAIGAAAVMYDSALNNSKHYLRHCVTRGKKANLGNATNATVFSGELKGIELGFQMVPTPGPPLEYRTVNIWTDNQAALRNIRKPKRCSGQQYLI
jgi:hypothetical protein